MNCKCDAELPFKLKFLHPGFKLIESRIDTIKAESLDVDGGMYGEGLKFEWELKKGK